MTATLPLWEIIATPPGSSGATESPHIGAREPTATMPLPFGPHTRQPAGQRGLAELLLQPAPAFDLAEAGREHDRPAAAARDRVGDHRRHPGGRDRDHHGVDRLGKVGHGGTQGRSCTSCAPRVDAPDVPLEPGAGQVAKHEVGVGARPVVGPDHGDRAWLEQRSGVGAGARAIDAAIRAAQWRILSTPRRSRPRATISRWISLVPSQIRSTRSSRSRRSATLERR